MRNVSNPPRIAVAGGFTAGHILPAIEFLRAYRAEFGAQGYLIGCPGGLETRIVPAMGERLELIPGAPLARQTWKSKTVAVAALIRGVAAARSLLRREKTEVVIGFGGYAAAGACLAAWSLGIPVVIHEANAVLGQANRFLMPFARRLCVAFEEVAPQFGGARVVRTGTPSRPVFARKAGESSSRLRILVIGGSQGSPHLNREAPKLIAILKKREAAVLHLTGDRDRAAVEGAYRSAGIDARVVEFEPDMAARYAETDFVISCAGGVCLAEIAAWTLPALLVPLSTAAGNHQVANARAFSLRTGTLWVQEIDWNAAGEARRIGELLNDPVALDRNQRRLAAWAIHDSSERMIRVCEELRR